MAQVQQTGEPFLPSGPPDIGLSTSVSQISNSLSAAISATSSLSNAVGGGAGTSTSLSQISSSLSGAISSTGSLSVGVSAVDANQSASLSAAVSSTTSLSTAISTVDANQSTSLSAGSSATVSLSTAVSTVDSGQTVSLSINASSITSLSTAAASSISTANSTNVTQSTSLSLISSSLSGAISSTTSLSTGVSTVDANQTASLSQVSSSLSGAISSTTSLSSAVSAAVTTGNLTVTTNMYFAQAAPTAINASATVTIAQLLTFIITCTSATAVSLTLPTGTLTDAGILGGALANDRGFEWEIINLGSASGAVTVIAGVGHTIVGNAVAAISTSSRWRTRKTATNTYVTYRIA